MTPLLELRNALDFRSGAGGQQETNDYHLRDFRRMSGAIQLFHNRPIPGPYTQEARENWLRKLLVAQTWIRQNGPPEVSNIELLSLAKYYRGPARREGVKLGFTAVDSIELRRGVMELSRILERLPQATII